MLPIKCIHPEWRKFAVRYGRARGRAGMKAYSPRMVECSWDWKAAESLPISRWSS